MIYTLSPAPISTKDRILDVAEQLFADHGFESTSLRQITTGAGVNLAAVNYHFQSKESLLDAVVARRIEPINRRRLQLLAEYETAAAGAPVPLEQVLDALLRPVLEGGMVPSLIVRFQYLESSDLFQRIFHQHIRPTLQRFLPFLHRAAPHLGPEETLLRCQFGMGAFSQVLAAGRTMTVISDGRSSQPDPQLILHSLIRFIAAGFRSPAVQEASHE